MKSSVYISSVKIEALLYSKSGSRVTIKDYAARPLPEGTMINGKIIDQQGFIECLKDLRDKRPGLFRKPSLIVDGSSIITKKMTAPKLTKKRYEQLVRDEFTDSTANIEDMVCGYYPLGTNAGGSVDIFAYAIEKAQVDSYMSAFNSVGIKLESIRIGMQAILNYINIKPDFQKSSFVLNVIDGVAMLSMIFDAGKNIFMSRTRLYSEDNEQYIHEIIENLSGLIQFNRSQNFNDIRFIYYLGVNKGDMDRLIERNPYSERINPDSGIKIDTPGILSGVKGAGKLPEEAHFVYLNTMLAANCVDLIKSGRAFEEYKKRQRPKKRWITALIGIAALLAVPVVLLFTQLSELDESIKAVTGYISDPAVVSKTKELDRINNETAYYNEITGAINAKTETEAGRVPVSNRVLNHISASAGGRITIISFDFDEGKETVRIEGRSATESDSARYVEALKRDSVVKDVRYAGYSYDNNGEYNFSIDVILNGGGAV